jgi:hypothetical protein
MTSLALGLHQKLVKQYGHSYPSTDEYWQKLIALCVNASRTTSKILRNADLNSFAHREIIHGCCSCNP